MAGTAPKRRRLAEYAARPKPATRPTSSCSPVREHRDSIPEDAGPAGQPSHIFHRRCACPAPPLQWDGGDGGTMAKKDAALKRLAKEIAFAELLKKVPPLFTQEELLALPSPEELPAPPAPEELPVSFQLRGPQHVGLGGSGASERPILDA